MAISDDSLPATTVSSAPPRRRFRLTSPSTPVDPHQHALRRDLADIALADRVFAQHYVEPMAFGVARAAVIHQLPRQDSKSVGTIAAGHSFHVLDIGRDWAWGRCAAAGCVGYVETSALAGPLRAK